MGCFFFYFTGEDLATMSINITLFLEGNIAAYVIETLNE